MNGKNANTETRESRDQEKLNPDHIEINIDLGFNQAFSHIARGIWLRVWCDTASKAAQLQARLQRASSADSVPAARFVHP